MSFDPELDHETLIQRLVETIRCPECKSPYFPQDLYVVAQDEDSWTLVASCAACGTESVIHAYLDELDEEDAAPPSKAEITAWRRFLEAFDGDLRDLLRQ